MQPPKSSLKPSKITLFTDKTSERRATTCCSPRTLHDLRLKTRVTINSPSNIKLSPDYMELGESSFIRQIHDKNFNKELYTKYQENFKKIIVDEEGNYLYTKIDQAKGQASFSRSFDRSLGLSEYNSFIDKKIDVLNQEDKVIEQNKGIEEYFLRKKMSMKGGESMRKKKKIPKDFINSLKETTYNNINEFITLKNKNDVIVNSKKQVDVLIREYGLMIEKVTKENQVLKEDALKMKLHLEETVELSDFLKRKNVLLIDQLKALQLKYEEQLNMTSELVQFEKSLKLLNDKFPNFTLEKLMNRYEILEETSLNLTRKLSELDDDKKHSDIDKQHQIAEYQDKFLFLAENDKRREKEFLERQNRINNQKIDKDEAFHYKEKYFLVFKRLIALFNKWNTKIKVYYNTNPDIDDENVILEDPLNVIDVLEKMVQISTPENLQAYLRKIIVAANKLQRNHFRNFVNERFDPEKIYDRIDKRLTKLMKERTKREDEKGKVGEKERMREMEKLFLE